MGRIRTIKPEFPQSESMGRISRDARLLFVLLWTLADDEGRGRGSPRMLASLLYPFDDDARDKLEHWLAELVEASCIQSYKAGGATYFQVCNWRLHQRIDKPTPSKFPAPDSEFAEPSSNPPGALPEHSHMEGKGREGNGNGMGSKDDCLRQLSSRPDKTGRDDPIKVDESFEPEGASERIPLVNGSVPNCPIGQVIDAYHDELPSLPRVVVRNTKRDRLISARWRQIFADGKAHSRDEGLDVFRRFFAFCGESKFLTGQAKPANKERSPFVADLEWLMSPTNFAKTIEGRYHR